MKTQRDKRLLLLALGLCLVGAALAGCRQDAAETEPAAAAMETTVPPTTQTEPAPIPLEISMVGEAVTVAQTVRFEGTADPRYPLDINGVTVYANEDGTFACELPLEVGSNTFAVTYLDRTEQFTAERRYTTAWYSYGENTSICSGASVYAELFARKGSSVVMEFQGQRQTAEPSVNQLGSGAPEGFQLYSCRFDTVSNNQEALELGPITYTVVCDGITETFTSGTITCQAAVEKKRSDPEATPAGYRDVGSGYIVEITDTNAETFNGNTIDDYSLPTMNYLPQGTVDYGTQGTYYNESANRHYYLLRCGVRVYLSGANTPYGLSRVVDCYNGYLPDHNEINIASVTVEDRFTYLTLDCLWKAPFFFDEELQDYEKPEWRKYGVDHYDAGYVDITFCYATQVTGSLEIPEDNPLFSHAELIQNESDHTLRLYLKEEGGFYGWTAYYNEAGQLCFKFLNPLTVAAADNAYGADLTGVRIMLDVGHGGEDPGASYYDSNGKYWTEAERNLALANLIRQELESIGAEVTMNRTVDKTLTRTERIDYLLEQAPDFCLCVHHNADENHDLNGYGSWYYTAYSQQAAQQIRLTTNETDAYLGTYISWHYYFLCRQTPCPVVLTENGYMSNKYDLGQMGKATVMEEKARAIVQGIVDYYLIRSGLEPSVSAQ